MSAIRRAAVGQRHSGPGRGAVDTRRGFTLIELLVISVLTAIVLAGLTTTLVRQQRFYRGTAEIIDTRAQIRQAAGILPMDLRGMSTAGGDLLEISDSAMVFRATIGSSVICFRAGTAMVVPPATLASGNTLTTWSLEPGPGDTAFVYDDWDSPAATDDRWQAYGITQAVSTVVNTNCLNAGLTTSSDAQPNYSFALSENVTPTIVVGAPVRFVRTTRYSLYKAADNNWYLGYCAPACGAGGPQALAGPFLAYGSGAGTGVRFTYLREDGSVTADPAKVAQVRVMVRAQTQGPVSFTGAAQQVVGDSLAFTVAIRNRR